jgi:uncharacterized protein YjdB
MRHTSSLLLLGGLALASACGFGTEPPGAPARLDPGSALTSAGVVGTVLRDSLIVRVVDLKGRGVPRQPVTWSVPEGSGTISPVEVLTNDRGIARAQWTLGQQAGTQMATASTVTTEGPLAVQFSAAAEPGPLAHMYISPRSATLGVDRSRQFTAVRTDAYGNTINSPAASWTTSAGEIAKVDPQSGTVHGVAPGSATIGATSEGKVATATVTVVQVLSLFSASDTIRAGVVGTSLREPLVVKVMDARGRAVAGEIVTWATSQGSMTPLRTATDAEGLARAGWTLGNRAGSQTATATVSTALGVSTVRFIASAAAGPVASLGVSPNAVSLSVGQSRTLNTVRADAYGNPITGGTVSWSTSAPGLVSVDANGVAHALAAGTATITATAGGKSGTATVAATTEAFFVDDFNSENGGRAADNYTGFSHWEVLDGSVDLVGAHPYDDFLPKENGIGVDLDGTSRNAATLRTKTVFPLQPGSYVLSFQLAGSPRPSDPNTVVVSLGTAYREEITLPNFAPLRTYLRTIQVREPTTARIVFDHLGGDSYGILLDNASLSRQ